ncbi:CNNM domain-containing protein, partial [Staphylococcus epidermidis]|uniref:CNNM domain-containing protein n=1 Tax=Staphylococcus epidermidis TaxID=1282 RepID=UPI0037D9D473
MTPTPLQQLLHHPNNTPKILKKIIHNLHYYLSPSQLPITLTSLPLPSLPQPTFQNIIHPLFHLLHLPTPLTTTISFLLSFILLTYLHLLLPQFPPKSFPIQHTQQLPL